MAPRLAWRGSGLQACPPPACLKWKIPPGARGARTDKQHRRMASAIHCMAWSRSREVISNSLQGEIEALRRIGNAPARRRIGKALAWCTDVSGAWSENGLRLESEVRNRGQRGEAATPGSQCGASGGEMHGDAGLRAQRAVVNLRAQRVQRGRDTPRQRASAPTKSARRTGSRRAPQRPGGPSNTPGQRTPHRRQCPSSVRFHALSTYQSRPIRVAPQSWQ